MLDNTDDRIAIDPRDLLSRLQNLNPDLFARVMAEARADKLAEMLQELRDNRGREGELNLD